MIASTDINESRGLSIEQELILTVKKELHAFYKELIKSLFADSKCLLNDYSK